MPTIVPIDIVCPTNDEPICEYKDGYDVLRIVKAHMVIYHPDWISVGHYTYIDPSKALRCPICEDTQPSKQSIANHIRHNHPGYFKHDGEWIKGSDD